jgi:hypothetical protein
LLIYIFLTMLVLRGCNLETENSSQNTENSSQNIVGASARMMIVIFAMMTV